MVSRDQSAGFAFLTRSTATSTTTVRWEDRKPTPSSMSTSRPPRILLHRAYSGAGHRRTGGEVPPPLRHACGSGGGPVKVRTDQPRIPVTTEEIHTVPLNRRRGCGRRAHRPDQGAERRVLLRGADSVVAPQSRSRMLPENRSRHRRAPGAAMSVVIERRAGLVVTGPSAAPRRAGVAADALRSPIPAIAAQRARGWVRQRGSCRRSPPHQCIGWCSDTRRR